MKEKKIIFCQNEISLTIAREMVKKYPNTIFSIYKWNNRSKVKHETINQIKPYNPLWVALDILTSIITRKTEFVVPHYLFGPIAFFIKNLSKNISLIDDGLDTWRECPANFNPAEFKIGTKFYTFEFPTKTAEWANKFEQIKICKISDLSKSVNTNPSNHHKTIVIESPPLEKITQQLPLDSIETLLITHPNRSKKKIKNFTCKSVEGNNVNVEMLIEKHNGEIYTGESMASIFAILSNNQRIKIKLIISNGNKKNLTPLIKLAELSEKTSVKYV